jgi:hypothetical protein
MRESNQEYHFLGILFLWEVVEAFGYSGGDAGEHGEAVNLAAGDFGFLCSLIHTKQLSFSCSH